MGSKERKARDFEKRQEMILCAAENLFIRKGVDGVRLEDIADAIEFSKGIIYLHFQSKEELFAHLLLRKVGKLYESLRLAAVNEGPMRDGIKGFLDRTVEFYRENREYYALLFHVDSHATRLPAELARDILARKRSCLTVFSDLLNRGKEQGELPADLSVDQLAMVLWGMLNGILQLVETHQANQKDLQGLVALAMNLVFDGVIKQVT